MSFMLSVSNMPFMLSVIMLNDIILCVVAPLVTLPRDKLSCLFVGDEEEKVFF
jgi:hypothetical protein